MVGGKLGDMLCLLAVLDIHEHESRSESDYSATPMVSRSKNLR